MLTLYRATRTPGRLASRVLAVASQRLHRVRSWIPGDTGGGRPAVLGVGFVLYFLSIPMGWNAATPLLWDCSSHYLGGLRVATALRSSQFENLFREIIAADLYPPMHSVVLGIWIAIAGQSVQSWLLFGLLVFIATLLVVSRSTIAGACILMVSPLLGGLAPSFMVESLSVLFLLSVFVWFDAMTRKTPCSLGAGMGLGALMGLTVLTKYNVGLPLFVCIPVAALASRRRDLMYAAVVGCIVGAGAWALFLTMQIDGWEMLARFAENRANSEHLTTLERLGWYAGAYVEHYGHSVWVSLLIAGSAIVGLRRVRPAWLAGVLYVASAMAALSMHPYVLTRNLVGPAATLAFVAGVGLRASPGRRWAGLGIGAIAILLAMTGLEGRRQEVLAYYPPRSEALSPVSASVERLLRSAPYPKWVVGTFNELGANWVWLLADRAGASNRVRVDVEYPLDTSRTGYASQWHEEYRAVAGSIVASDVRHVIGIELDDDSPFRDGDFEAWSAWKANVVRALRETGAFSIEIERFEVPGATVVSMIRSGPQPSIEFESGWEPAEAWGRWATQGKADLRIAPSPVERRMVYSVATSAELPAGQDWTVSIEGERVAEESLPGNPWAYEEFEVLIPPSRDPLSLTFQFSKKGRTPGGRAVALAFASITLETGSAAH